MNSHNKSFYERRGGFQGGGGGGGRGRGGWGGGGFSRGRGRGGGGSGGGHNDAFAPIESFLSNSIGVNPWDSLERKCGLPNECRTIVMSATARANVLRPDGNWDAPNHSSSHSSSSSAAAVIEASHYCDSEDEYRPQQYPPLTADYAVAAASGSGDDDTHGLDDAPADELGGGELDAGASRKRGRLDNTESSGSSSASAMFDAVRAGMQVSRTTGGPGVT